MPLPRMSNNTIVHNFRVVPAYEQGQFRLLIFLSNFVLGKP